MSLSNQGTGGTVFNRLPNAGAEVRGLLATAIATIGLVACGNSDSGVGLSLPPPLGGGDTLVCAPITLPTMQGAGSAIDTPPPAYDWQAGWQSCEVLFSSRLYGSQLYGVLFAPLNIDLARDRLPAVVIAPGSVSGVQSQYQWSARELAANGYIVLTVDPQGVGHSELVDQPQTADNYVDALASALDYLLSDNNPLRANVDADHLGAAGHSLSARAVSYIQGEDSRIKAIVAWDNLSSTLAGDAGIASGGGAGGAIIGGEVPGGDPRPVTQRVPAMGQASDAPGGTTQDTDPEVKKTGYSTWRNAGLSAMQIVFQDKAHADWGQAGSSSTDSASPKSMELKLFQHYTRAWFDLWLRNDRSAIKRLTAAQVADRTTETIYSLDFRSALYLPDAGIDCPDILTGGCPAFAP